jgi:UDP-N-acetylmuramoyl-tripeptide--D-alanyl-D-alanine ligase
MKQVQDFPHGKHSLALQRLLSVLELEKNIQRYDWLYICARHHGIKLGDTWVKTNEDVNECIQRTLGTLFLRATSFELEMLNSPQKRDFCIGGNNQLNSLRGKRALFIYQGGKFSRWSATEMIAKNLSFSQAVDRHISKEKFNRPDLKSLPVTLYHTRQFYCDNQPEAEPMGRVLPTEMFRGSRLVNVEEINKASVLHSMRAMAGWLVSNVNKLGASNYKYWPSRGVYSQSNNAIRQWMATICLHRIGKSSGNKQIGAIAAKNLAYNISTMVKREGALGYIWMNGSAKLGASALAALAIFESPQRKLFLREEYALHSLVQSLGNADGSFDTFYIPRERKDNQNFYSGEALLFLAARYSVSRNPAELERIMSAFYYYRDWHRNNRNPAFVPWHTQAYYLVWQVTKDEELKKFILEMNDWLLPMQQWASAEFPDMQGRFYDPVRPHFGPPHGSSTGVYLEGLIDAFALANECGDQTRAEAYRIAIVRGIRSLMQLQYKDAVDCFYIKHVDRVLGGLRTTVYDNTVRIDNVQHGLMALLKIHSRFSARDYQLDPSDNQLAGIKGDSVSVCYATTKSLARSELWSREEVFETCSITRTYNDRDWTARSVVARSARPQSGSLYFAKKVASEELKLLRANPQAPAAIITAPETARILSHELSIPIYEVGNLLEAARSLADVARCRTSATIVGVTGSVGKTSVKDALAQVLAMQGVAYATKANANDGWGVLNTLMNLQLDARFAVMELGMLGVGSIKTKSQRIKPHVGIVTNIHDAHLAYHRDESSIARTKSGLFAGLMPGGVAILPRDSAWYEFLKENAELADGCRVITFGTHPKADLRLIKTIAEGNESIVHASMYGKPIAFRMGASGEHWGLNAMTVLAAVHAADADVDSAIKAMATIRPSFRRGEVHRIKAGSKNYTLIDDTWNASPISVVAALRNMASIELEQGARRILCIGDMLQLGRNERQKHIELIELIISSGIDLVFAVGELSKALFEELPLALRGDHFYDAEAAEKQVKKFIGNGDVILVKGSNAMRMWRVSRSLLSISQTTIIVGTPPTRMNIQSVSI